MTIKAYKEIGFSKAVKFICLAPMIMIFDLLPYPFLRIFFLRLFGAKIGRNVVIGKIRLVNFYRYGIKGLSIGNNCFIGDYVLIDLADKITLEENVSVSFNASLITHLNVGYKDHGLQRYFPARSARILIGKNCFIGANSTILCGVTLKEGVFVAASSLLNRGISDSWVLVSGTPGSIIRKLDGKDSG